MSGGAAIRVVNYHQTLPENAETFESHLQWYSRNFVPATKQDLQSIVRGEAWRMPRPGIILTFDDGLRSNFEVAAPLLERHGMRGWFFFPSEFVECLPEQQLDYAGRHDLLGAMLQPPLHDGRVAMNWAELKDLSIRGHEMGIHTHSHARLGADVALSTLNVEICLSKSLAESRLGASVSSFCWVGGEADSYSRRAATMIKEAGYEFAFQTTCALSTSRTHPLQIPRTNVEDRWPVSMASFQTSGFLDLAYLRKRRAVRLQTQV